MRKWRASVLAACCASSAFASASGSSPKLPERPFFYSTNGSSVADALTALSRAAHVPVDIDGDVDGRLAGRYAMRPAQFLDVLSASLGLLWYYDGAVIHVEPVSARKSVEIVFNYVPATQVKAKLERAGVEDHRMPIAVSHRCNMLTVSGPSSYVERVSRFARHIEDEARERVVTDVRVVPLHFENAADRTFAVADQTVTGAGLATRLQRRAHRLCRSEGATTSDTTSQRIEFDAPLPIFEADARTNSVLVRDQPQRIDADRQLVARFDRQPRAMSIRTYVLDVAPDGFDTLGVDRVAAHADDTDGVNDAKVSSAGPGRTILHDGGSALLAQVDALARSGKARVCIDRNLVTVDHAPVSVDCREVDSADWRGLGDGKDRQSMRAFDGGASVVIEPDLSAKGSASLFELVTTVRAATPLRSRDDGVARSRQSPPISAATPVRTMLAKGDALVVFDQGGADAAAGSGWARIVVVVPTPIEG